MAFDRCIKLDGFKKIRGCTGEDRHAFGGLPHFISQVSFYSFHIACDAVGFGRMRRESAGDFLELFAKK